MLNEYEIFCPGCIRTSETTEFFIEIARWTDISLDLKCSCKKCGAIWVEHFAFPRGSYKGYTFNGKEYAEDGNEI